MEKTFHECHLWGQLGDNPKLLMLQVVISNIFRNFRPDSWGFMIQFRLALISFRWVGEKPPTSAWMFQELSKRLVNGL